MRPDTIVEAVGRTDADGDWDHHLREFLDAFYGRHGDLPAQVRMLADEPAMLGIDKVDAIFGGVAEHLARRWGLSIPGWVRGEGRYLKSAMFWPDEKSLRLRLISESPVSFRSRLIFTGAEPLHRARFPRVRTP